MSHACHMTWSPTTPTLSMKLSRVASSSMSSVFGLGVVGMLGIPGRGLCSRRAGTGGQGQDHHKTVM